MFLISDDMPYAIKLYNREELEMKKSEIEFWTNPKELPRKFKLHPQKEFQTLPEIETDS